MNVAAIPCGPFIARATYEGYGWGSTLYTVSAVVRTVAEAVEAVAAIRAVIAADPTRTHWREDDKAEPRLVSSDWRGNPVSVVINYIATEPTETP